MLRITAFCLIFLVSAVSQQVPAPLGYVSDYAGVLDERAEAEITSDIRAIESATGVEVAVAILTDLGGQSIDALSVEYFDRWKIGKRGADNGVLILVAINDRKAWITVGYGLEGVLPDGLVGEIYRREMVPRFRQGDYAGGIKAVVYKIGRIVGGEKIDYPKTRRRPTEFSGWVLAVFIILIIISSMISRFQRRRRGIFLIPPIFIGGSRSGGWGSGSSGGFGGFGGFGGGSTGGGGAGGSW